MVRVIAEGVETAEQLAFLQPYECDEAQGFFFSRPIPAEQYAELLASGVAAPSLAGRYASSGSPTAS